MQFLNSKDADLDKKWKKVEKVIAIIGILFGSVFLSFFLFSWTTTLFQLVEDGYTTWEDISILYFLKNQFPNPLQYVFSIISGILLLKNLRIGWITSILSWFFQAAFFVWTLFKVDGDLFADSNKGLLVFVSFVILILLTLPTILLLKPFRENYFKLSIKK